MKIYIVFGQSGEYSSREEHAVKAFNDKEKAEDFVYEAAKIANMQYQKHLNDELNWGEMKSELDPKMCDHAETTYFLGEVELV